MARLLLSFAIICYAGLVSAVPQYTTYLLPEHRPILIPREPIEELSLNNYELQIVPRDQYELEEFDDSKDSLSLFDLIPLPSPITALVSVASKALSIGKWILLNSGFVILGAALLFGFCAFTPYCTLTIEAPLTAKIRSLNHFIPYLDDVECFFKQAYKKYHK